MYACMYCIDLIISNDHNYRLWVVGPSYGVDTATKFPEYSPPVLASLLIWLTVCALAVGFPLNRLMCKQVEIVTEQ